MGSCVACKSPCKTCYKAGSFCTSCTDGYSLIGNKCRSSVYVGFTTKININMSLYCLISNTFMSYFITICSKVRTITRNTMFISTISNGSTDVSGGVSADSSSA
jgi:hypothetical protein